MTEKRIYDRILEMCTLMYVRGTSKREAIASMKMNIHKDKMLWYNTKCCIRASYEGAEVWNTAIVQRSGVSENQRVNQLTVRHS